MSILSAENSFKNGLVALTDGRPKEAAALFQAAMTIERERGAARRQMKYLSYYGLATAMAHGATHEAIRACETAAEKDFFNPNLLLNLGKVYLMAGKITRALATLERARKIAPRHEGIRAELAKTDRRRLPPIRFLGRNHPLNVWLGKIRASFSGGMVKRIPHKRTV